MDPATFPSAALQGLVDPNALVAPGRALVAAEARAEITPELLYDVQKVLGQFSLELSRHLPEKASFCLSSASIAAVFAMILQGLSAADKAIFLAKSQLQAYSPQLVLEALGEIIKSLECASDSAKVTVANVIALKEPVAKSYLESFQKTFNGQVIPLSNDQATEEVNRLISLQTDGLIEKLLSPGALNNATCALINALAFEAKWEKRFDKATLGTFTEASGNQVPCMMMSKTMHVTHFKGQDCHFIEVPYLTSKGHKHTFVIVLPEGNVSLSKLMDGLTPDIVTSMRQRASSQEIKLVMPKLSIQYKLENLRELLQGMGLPVDKELRELACGAQVDKIISEVTLDVDEDGTRGAAATAALVMRGATPPTVSVDRPFAFFVVDNHTPIFQGHVQDRSFLVTEETNKKLLLKGLKPSLKRLNETQVIQFLKENADMKVTMSYVPLQMTKPRIDILTLRGIRFTLVNYTDVEIDMFYDQSRSYQAPFFFTINRQFSSGGFTPDHCQVVFYPGQTQDSIISVSKDEGANQPRDVVRMRWEVATGLRSSLPFSLA